MVSLPPYSTAQLRGSPPAVPTLGKRSIQKNTSCCLLAPCLELEAPPTAQSKVCFTVPVCSLLWRLVEPENNKNIGDYFCFRVSRSWAQTTHLETVRTRRIITYIWARILLRTQAIWLALDDPLQGAPFPQQCSPTHLLRVPRGALVPPAPWVMLEFLLAVMVISALCKPRALQRHGL